MKTQDECLYFAKATKPSLQWRTPYCSRDEAIANAQRYVRDWRDNGAKVEACVFYRDGSIQHVVTPESLPL